MKHDLRSELDRLLRRLELERNAGLTRGELRDVILELKRIIDFVLPRETAR